MVTVLSDAARVPDRAGMRIHPAAGCARDWRQELSRPGYIFDVAWADATYRQHINGPVLRPGGHAWVRANLPLPRGALLYGPPQMAGANPRQRTPYVCAGPDARH